MVTKKQRVAGVPIQVCATLPPWRTYFQLDVRIPRINNVQDHGQSFATGVVSVSKALVPLVRGQQTSGNAQDVQMLLLKLQDA